MYLGNFVKFTHILFIAILSIQCYRIETPTEHYRPNIHFTSLKNWINDPNGLIFVDGIFHLYFQHNPFGNNWGSMSWGHAISKDLFQWKELPVAMKEDGFFFYPKMKFSGSIVLDKNNSSGLCHNSKECMIAIFTEWTLLNQTQNISISNDSGLSFQEYEKNPIIQERSFSFRDPKVFWHEAMSRFVMVVSRPSKQKLEIYTSKNLKSWNKESEITEVDFRDGIWECPDLFFLTEEKNSEIGKWVLLISVAETKRGSYMKYLLGNFDGKKFEKDKNFSKSKILDHGFDFYAAISWENLPNNERTIIGWMNNWEYANHLPTFPWKGAMSLPRKLILRKIHNEYILAQVPREEIENYKTSRKKLNPIQLNNNSKSIPLVDDSFELKFTLTKHSSKKSGVKIENENESFVIDIDFVNHSISFDRSTIQNPMYSN
ncbi:MAG: glycoside hydrolase family 32 protein, partial [Leptospiraceae bacterium]|nr:glycoside hydrolase family 32 protein [Leptospiraceae bacterium]